MVELLDMPHLRCTRCGHTWIPRQARKPKVCPNLRCKSPYWDRERRKAPKGDTYGT